MTKAGRKIKKITAVLLALIVLGASFGAASLSSTKAAAFTKRTGTAYFNNVAEITGADVLIPDSDAFSLASASKSSEISTSSSGTGWIYKSSGTFENTNYSENVPIIYWNDWDNAESSTTTVKSGSGYTWRRVTTDSGFTLKWTGAAQTTDGTQLDVEITVGQVIINYVSSASGLDSSGDPVCDCVIMFSSPDGSLYLTSNEYGSGSSYIIFSVEIPMTIKFYRTGTSTVYDGTYCFYARDVDVTDRLTGYYCGLRDGISFSDISDQDGYYTENYAAASNSAYQEKWTLNTSTTDGYVYFYSSTLLSLDTSSGTIYGNGEEIEEPASSTTAAFYAALPSKSSSIKYTSSGSAFSKMFASYSESYYKLYLTKSGVDSEGNDSSSSYSLAKGLFKVTDSAGYVKGYFITDASGTGYLATTDSSYAYSTSFYAQYGGTKYYQYAQTPGTDTCISYLSLPADTYTVTEVAAPSGYSADASSKTAVLSYTNQSAAVSFTDTVNVYPVVVRCYTSDEFSTAGSVSNLFINSCNGYSLEGAVYYIYDSGWNYVTRVQTDSQPYESSFIASCFAASDTVYLEAGTYYIREISASDGYLVTNPNSGKYAYAVKFTVSSGTSVQYVDVYEDIDTTGLSLQKTDDSGNALEKSGIRFKLVYSYISNTGSSTKKTLYYDTDSDGVIDFTDSSYLASGTPFYDASGNIIFGEGTITLTETSATVGYKLSDEEITITLTVSSSGSLSASYSSNASVSNSIISFPNTEMKIETVLLDDDTQSHYACGDGTVSLTDTVSYYGLDVGETYTVKGFLVDITDIDNDAWAYDDNGETMNVSYTLNCTSQSGQLELSYSSDEASCLSGHTLYSAVFIYDSGGSTVMSHTDFEDTDQTVYVSDLDTELLDDDTGADASMADTSVNLTDTVTYTNLPVKKYLNISAKLYDLTTGAYALDDSGNEITASKSIYLSSSSSGSTSLSYSFSGESLAGHVLVSYVSISARSDGTVYAAEEDPDNESQTVYLPYIDTLLTASDGTSKTINAAGEITLKDMVTFSCLPAASYKLVTKIVNRDDPDEEVQITGSSEKEFTTSSNYVSRSYIKTITPSFDCSALNGYYVAYEYLYIKNGDEWVLVASHEDASDEDQTVQIISTADVIIYKTDSSDPETGVEGASYALYRAASEDGGEDELITAFTTDEDGSSGLIEGLVIGDYYFYETQAADGYFIDETVHEFTVDTSDAGTTIEITVNDGRLELLPSAGGPGTAFILTASIVLALSGMAALRAGRRRRHIRRL